MEKKKPMIFEYRRTRDLIAAYNYGTIMEPGSLTITAMVPVAKAISEFSDGYVIAAESLINNILKDWYLPSTKVALATILGTVIREFDGEKKRILSHSKTDIIQSIKLMTEIGVEPRLLEKFIEKESLDNENDKNDDYYEEPLVLFYRIYKSFCEKDKAGKGFRKKFFDEVKAWDNKEYLLGKIAEIIVEDKETPDDKINSSISEEKRAAREKIHKEKVDKVKGELEKMKHIYLQGFFYFTTTQKLLLRALLRLGEYEKGHEDEAIQVVFLNNMERIRINGKEELHPAYEIWGENNFFKDLEREPLPKVDVEEDYADLLYEKVLRLDDNWKNKRKECLGAWCNEDRKIMSFSDIFSFVCHLQKDDRYEKDYVYAPSGDEVKDIVASFFPDCQEKKHLLSYPVGQYLMLLYQMWDSEENVICYDIDKLRHCVATGWATNNLKDSSKCMQALERVAVYFDDCHKRRDWIKRYKSLRHDYKNILPEFDYLKRRQVPQAHKRWHNNMGNPLRQIGFYSLDKKDFKVMWDVVRKITNDVKLLFSSGIKDSNKISLEIHFNNLVNILNGHVSKDNMTADEKAVVEYLKERLSNPGIWKGMECHIEDLADAMKMFLGGTLDDNDEEHVNSMMKGPSDEARRIVPMQLFTVEAQLFANRKQPAIVAFCDDKNIPGTSRPYPWPFNDRLMDSLEKTIEREVKADKLKSDSEMLSRLHDYIANKRNMRLSNRYIFFLALQLRNVELTWVEEINKTKFSPSPYIGLLKESHDEEGGFSDSVFKNDWQEEVVVYKSQEGYWPKELEDKEIPWEVKLNDRYCVYRNLYDYGLRQEPYFRDSFNLEKYACRLATLIRLKLDIKDKYNLLDMFKVFKIWNEAEQKEKAGFISSDYKTEDSRFENCLDGYVYNPNRLYLKYILSKDEFYKLKYIIANADIEEFKNHGLSSKEIDTLKMFLLEDKLDKFNKLDEMFPGVGLGDLSQKYNKNRLEELKSSAMGPSYYRCMSCPNKVACYYEVREDNSDE